MSFVVVRTFVALALYGGSADIHADLGASRRQGGGMTLEAWDQLAQVSSASASSARGLPLIMGVHESLLSGGQKEKVSNNTISTNSRNGDGFGPCRRAISKHQGGT
jgi:hypothetical protein